MYTVIGADGLSECSYVVRAGFVYLAENSEVIFTIIILTDISEVKKIEISLSIEPKLVVERRSMNTKQRIDVKIFKAESYVYRCTYEYVFAYGIMYSFDLA